MNCKDMMQIPELTEVLKLKAGKNGLEQSVRWIYFADCLQCVKSEYKIENYIHGDERQPERSFLSTSGSRSFRIEGADIFLQGSGNLYITFPCGRFQNPGYLCGRKNRKAAAGR